MRSRSGADLPALYGITSTDKIEWSYSVDHKVASHKQETANEQQYSYMYLLIYPFPFISYILNAHFNLSSILPREVTDKDTINSWKSITPSPFLSNARNACSANFDGSPFGKKLEYIALNSSIPSWPLGQSFLKPLYHSLISFSSNSVVAERSAKISGLNLLCCFPIFTASNLHKDIDFAVIVIVRIISTSPAQGSCRNYMTTDAPIMISSERAEILHWNKFHQIQGTYT